MHNKVIKQSGVPLLLSTLHRVFNLCATHAVYGVSCTNSGRLSCPSFMGCCSHLAWFCAHDRIHASLGGRTDPVLRRVQRRAQRAGQQRKSYCARHRYPALYRFTYSSSSSSLLCVRVCVPFFLEVFLRKVLRKNCSLAELFSERNDLYLLSLVFFSFSASSSSTR